MRNIRLLVEFASVVMPGAVLLLAFTMLYAPPRWIAEGWFSSAAGIASAIAISFALGHVLQGFAHVFVEPAWRRLQGGGPVVWAIARFAGYESRRFLTAEQLEQLDIQFPVKLSIPFPAPADSGNHLILDCTMSHVEAFLQTAKVAEALEDTVTDLKLNKGLFTAFLLIGISIPPVAHGILWLAVPGAVLAALAAFVRMDLLDRKYVQGLFLLLLTTPVLREGVAGRGGNAGGGGGGGFPIPMSRGAGLRHGGSQSEEEHG